MSAEDRFVAAAMSCGEYLESDLRATWRAAHRQRHRVELAQLYARRSVREDLTIEQRLGAAQAVAVLLEVA